jgi:magnesium-transporting ATPase (P-type)
MMQPLASTAPTALPGLTSEQAVERLERDGPNLLPGPRARHPGVELLRQLTHLFAVMLWAAAGMALLAGMPQLAVAIVVVVAVNGVFAFLQEYRADRAASRLRELVPARASVRRDGVVVTVDVADVVEGDAVVLTAGERVCADVVLGQVHSLAVDESLLTGESVPAHPQSGHVAWCGTFGVEGEGEGLVRATGTRSRLAGIAALTVQAPVGASPLRLELRRVVRAVSLVAAVVGVSLFGCPSCSAWHRPRRSSSASGSLWRWFPRGCCRR